MLTKWVYNLKLQYYKSIKSFIELLILFNNHTQKMRKVPEQIINKVRQISNQINERCMRLVSSVFEKIGSAFDNIAIQLVEQALNELAEKVSKCWLEERIIIILQYIQDLDVIQTCSVQFEVRQVIAQDLQIIPKHYHLDIDQITNYDQILEILEVLKKQIINGYQAKISIKRCQRQINKFIQSIYFDFLYIQPRINITQHEEDLQNQFEQFQQYQYNGQIDSYSNVQAQFFNYNSFKINTELNVVDQQCNQPFKIQLEHQTQFEQKLQESQPKKKLKVNAEKAIEIQLYLSFSSNLSQIKQILNYQAKSQVGFNSLQLVNYIQNYKNQFLCLFPSVKNNLQLSSQVQRQIMNIQELSNDIVGAKITTQHLIFSKLPQNLFQLQEKLQKNDFHQIIKMVFSWQYNSIKLLQLEQQMNKLFSITFMTYSSYKACKKHFRNIYYVCTKQYIKDRIYLCNLCIGQIKLKGNHHQGHQIYCKEHLQPVNFKLLNQTQFDFLGKDFGCHKCKDEIIMNKNKSNKNSRYPQMHFVSQCHYQIMSEICIDLQCIKKNQFLLCPVCMPQEHNDHFKASFNKESLMSTFKVNQQVNISSYEQLFLDLRQKLKLKPIAKIVNSFYEKIWIAVRSFESLVIHSDKQIQEWVQFVLAEGKKEDLLVLWRVQQLKKNNFCEIDRHNYLQTCTDLLSSELSILFKQISDLLQHFQQIVNKISKKDQQDINYFLFKKYQTIKDTQIGTVCTISPFNLKQINQIHHHRIQQIIINKQSEENNDQIIQKNQKKFRTNFFLNEFFGRLNLNDVSQKDQSTIFELFAKATFNFYKDTQLEIQLDQLGVVQRYQLCIRQLKNYLQQTQNQFKIKRRNCLPLCIIIQQKLINLKIIYIKYQYNDRKYFFSERLRYSIEAVELFKLIHQNEGLKQITIKGVQITKTQQLIQKLYKCIHHQQIQSQTEKMKWLQNLQPSQDIKMSLETEFQFNFDRIQQLLIRIQYFLSFINLFHNLSDVTIWIKLGKMEDIERWNYIMEDLLLHLKQLKKIKLNIQGKQQQICSQSANILNLSLIKKLYSFKQISQIQFLGIRFSKQVTAQCLTMMEDNLYIFFLNNVITHLGLCKHVRQLDWCYNFPIISKLNTLKSINFHYVQFRKQFSFMDEVTSTNLLLQSIKCYGTKDKWTICQRLFNQLQTLTIQDCKDVSFSNMTSQSSSLKNLCIKQPSIGKIDYLSMIFPKLVSLSYLKLSDIDFGYELLSMIPSVYLKQLSLLHNQIIDLKWPYLYSIRLQNCKQVTENALQICKFKRLAQLIIDKRILEECSSQTFSSLKSRGIKVLRWL